MLNPILVILLAPAVTTLALFFLKEDNKRGVRFLAWLGTLISLIAAIYLFLSFPNAPVDQSVGDHGYKYVTAVNWVPELGLQFKVGADGVSVALLLLTALTIFTGVMVSFTIQSRVKEYYINLLALVTGVFGVFAAQDLFFYYFFYELAVIPMFLLIGIWGSTTKTVDRHYATMKLVILLSTGAVVVIFAAIYLFLFGI